MFKEVDLNDNKNLFTVAAILISGIGGLALKIPYQIAENGSVAKVITVTSIATALILGLVTRAVCLAIEKRNKPEEAKPEEAKVEDAE